MQGLADGYFILPYTIGNYLAGEKLKPLTGSEAEFGGVKEEAASRLSRLKTNKGDMSVDALHRKLGHIMWDYCGMARNEAGLVKAGDELKKIKEEFWQRVRVPGDAKLNAELEKAARVADFIELGQLMVKDALERRESCGGHFREEMQTEDGEAKRNDDEFCYAAAWEFQGEDKPQALHKEELKFENIQLAQRSYK
jgi:succinate dehydrogenase / fumarate reductase flavoprotein subunit